MSFSLGVSHFFPVMPLSQIQLSWPYWQSVITDMNRDTSFPRGCFMIYTLEGIYCFCDVHFLSYFPSHFSSSNTIWVASSEKVPNVLGRHTKRRTGNLFSFLISEFFFLKSVSYQKKDDCDHACPSFLGIIPTQDIRDLFV